MTLAETPTLDASGAFYVVRVYDSAAEAHFDDTRKPDGQPSPKGATGIGSGFINLQVDGQGRPIAYLFAPPLNAEYSYRPSPSDASNHFRVWTHNQKLTVAAMQTAARKLAAFRS
jgi:hypothetical protein